MAQPLVRARDGGVGYELKRAALFYGLRDGSDGDKVLGVDGASFIVVG